MTLVMCKSAEDLKCPSNTTNPTFVYRVVQKVIFKRHLCVCQVIRGENYIGPGGRAETWSCRCNCIVTVTNRKYNKSYKNTIILQKKWSKYKIQIKKGTTNMKCSNYAPLAVMNALHRRMESRTSSKWPDISRIRAPLQRSM